MRVLICGGRDFADFESLYNKLETFHTSEGKISEVCHGGAAGADTAAGIWAKDENIPIKVYKANWKKHGKAAGPIRNQQMLDEFKPDAVIAFAGGKGTADMIRRAELNGVKVYRMF